MVDIQDEREDMRNNSREEAEGIMLRAGFKILHTWELANGYWPLAEVYDDVRCPWWLFLTDIGLIQIGWRKNVLHIEWSATPIRCIVTANDVTKSQEYVHAHSTGKAVEYLKELRRLALEKVA